MAQYNLKKHIENARSKRADLVVKNARVVNVFTEEIEEGDVGIADGLILGIGSYDAEQVMDANGAYLCPGLIDAHLHIESSMAHPSRFCDAVLEKGTTTLICDPHEMANVCGARGIRYMLRETEDSPLNAYFMIPSCVPCTSFETSGAKLYARDMEEFLSHPRVLGLGEVMDSHAVLNCEDTMLEKLALFEGGCMDGHAPLLTGDALNAYISAGPRTDHECAEYWEVKEKMGKGMYILLRVGSACRGMDGIFRQIAAENLPTRRLCFCTDDKHLEDIRAEGHVNYILRRAVRNGINPVHAVQMATINSAEAHRLRRIGAISPGYRADLVLFDNLKDFNTIAVITNGKQFVRGKERNLQRTDGIYDSVRLAPRKADCLYLRVHGKMPVINAVDNELLTNLTMEEVPSQNGFFTAANGLLKLALLERHHASGRIALGIMRGFRLKNGAVASTVGHDSHNLVVAGDNDADMLKAIELLEECGGGFVVVSNGVALAKLPLPIAGLMSDLPLQEIVERQQQLLDALRGIGSWSGESDPLVWLSFISLPVLPNVRLTDMGVFDVSKMEFINKEGA